MAIHPRKAAKLAQWAEYIASLNPNPHYTDNHDANFDPRQSPAEDAIDALEILGLIETLGTIEDSLRVKKADRLADIIQEATAKIHRELRGM